MYVEKEEHKNQQNAYLLPFCIAPRCCCTRVGLSRPALLPTPVPSRPVTSRMLLYYTILYVTHKEIIVEEEEYSWISDQQDAQEK